MIQIESGELAAGDRLPSERELGKTHQINRQTVRQGLAVLLNRGLVEKKRGLGTFVAKPRLERLTSEFLDFSERMKQQGYTPGSSVMRFTKIKPSDKLAADLALQQGAEVYQIHRLRTLNGAPIVLEMFSTPVDLAPNIDQFDLNQRSFYEVLRTEFQIHVTYSRQSLEAVALSEMEAQWLQGEPGMPAMLEHRLAFDQNDRPIESGTDLYRGDRVRFNSSAKLSVSLR